MVKINFMGDVMLGELLENYRRGLKTFLMKKGVDPFEQVRPVLEDVDLNVINLECVLGDSSILKRPFSEILIAPEEFLKCLTSSGVSVINTANNHALDHGKLAFERSVGFLKESGIHVIGYDIACFFQVEPVIVEKRGTRLGFLGYNISNFPDLEKRRSIDSIKDIAVSARQSVDKLIVSIHWGEEYTNIPPAYIVRFGKELLEAGVDILHGHHSHQIQGVTKIGNRIFAPSLGNFIFDQMIGRNRITAILRVDIDDDGNLTFQYLPYYMNDCYQPVEAPEHVGYISEITAYLEECMIEGKEDIYRERIDTNIRKGHMYNRIRMRAMMMMHFWDYLPHLGRIFMFKRSGESIYSVIKDEKSLTDASKENDF